MAYDTDLEARIEKITTGWDLTKKKMFGGVGYLLGGNMTFGVHKNELIIRASEEKGQELLKQPGIRVFDMTGRPMKNWFMASGDTIKDEKRLLEYLETGRDFALSLPPK